jgi:hypothetical protein
MVIVPVRSSDGEISLSLSISSCMNCLKCLFEIWTTMLVNILRECASIL